MARNWIKTGLGLIAAGIALIAAFVAGLFVYMNATMRPLHPDANAVSSVTQSTPPPKWTAAVEKGREIVRGGLTAQNLPGISVAVGTGGDVVWAEGFGWADLETRSPVTPYVQFRTGGISMALTSAAVGLLLEQDTLNLGNDIQLRVPGFPEKQWPVTLRQLMGHVGGVRGDSGDEEPLLERCEKTVDGLRRFADTPLRFEPESSFRYSTYGWILVSAAVESAAEQPFFPFMRARIFEPLGMRDTVADSATEPIPHRAAFYHPRFAADPRYGPETVRERDYSCFAGGGAFLSTPSDLVRFGMAIEAGKVLKPATVKLLQTPQRLTSGEETGYGLGWDLETVSLSGRPTPMVGHESEFTMGGTASFMTFPEQGIVVAVMTNTAFADTSTLASRIAEAFAYRSPGAPIGQPGR
jgi:CubicO group peptidase (beta-lactamase class C family)